MKFMTDATYPTGNTHSFGEPDRTISFVFIILFCPRSNLAICNIGLVCFFFNQLKEIPALKMCSVIPFCWSVLL